MKFRLHVLLVMVVALGLFVSGCTAAGDETIGSSSSGNGSGVENSSGENSSGENSSGAGDADSAGEGGAEEKLPGIMSQFTAVDLDGNTLDQSILEDYDITMVNVWATFCGNCIGEMPDLSQLARDNAENGLNIIGLVTDVVKSDGSLDQDQVDLAKQIIDETDTEYLNILPTEDFYGILSQIAGVPTAFFVDKDGRQVGTAYSGAKSKEKWQKIIDEVLAEVNK